MDTFQDFVDQALALRQLRPGTVREYRRLASHARQLADRPVPAITCEDVLECLADARQAGLSEKSVKDLLGFMRSVLRDADSHVADRIRVKAPEPDLHVLTEAQTQALRAQLEGLGTPAADALLVLLATGIRRGELLALEARDWRPADRQLHIARSVTGPTKSGRTRYVDVPDWIAARVEKAARYGGQLYSVSPDQLTYALAQASDQAQVPRCRVHDLRHSRITRLLLAGVPVLYVSQQAGHHSVSFTMDTYGHLVIATREQRREWSNA